MKAKIKQKADELVEGFLEQAMYHDTTWTIYGSEQSAKMWEEVLEELKSRI